MEVRNRLKEIRMKEHMIDSKREFSKMIDIEEHTYLKWENGATPTLKTALMVAKKLNKRVEDIWYLD
jgi:putative transcriptional regulator